VSLSNEYVGGAATANEEEVGEPAAFDEWSVSFSNEEVGEPAFDEWSVVEGGSGTGTVSFGNEE
jgi:hypothetical protein